MNEADQNAILKRGEFNVKNLRLIALWGSVLVSLILGGVYFYLFISKIFTSSKIQTILIEHAKASIGIPLSLVCSMVLITVFEKYSGEIQLKIPGFELKGATGPLLLWIACFLAMITGINILW